MKLSITLMDNTEAGSGIGDEVRLARRLERWPSMFPHEKTVTLMEKINNFWQTIEEFCTLTPEDIAKAEESQIHALAIKKQAELRADAAFEAEMKKKREGK